MNSLNHIINLLNEKRANLIAYEVFSTKLVESDLDLLNNLLDQRAIIIQAINTIDANILDLAKQSTEQKIIMDIILRNILEDEISEEYALLYEGIQSIHGSLENIKVLERSVNMRINNYKEELYLNIKQTNNVTKIKKYFETYETEMDEMTLMISKSSKA